MSLHQNMGAVTSTHLYTSSCGTRSDWNPRKCDPTAKSESYLDIEITVDEDGEDTKVGKG